MIRNRTHARETLAFVFLMSCIVLAFAKCTPSAPPPPSPKVAEHSAALLVCLLEGKDAGSRAVYRRCADEADIKYLGPDGGMQ